MGGSETQSLSSTSYAVWSLEDAGKKSLQGTTLLNPCLALMKHLMSCRDKEHIQNVICSRFSLDALKEAREILYTYSDPEERYVYRGPNKVVNVRDRCSHAFDGIFSKLGELDGKDKMPKIACPSEDMGLLLSLHSDPIAVDDRFRALEKQTKDLQQRFQELASTIVNNDNEFPRLQVPSGIQPSTRTRLASENGKRRRTEEGETPGSDTEYDSSMEDFTLPHGQLKKLARRSYRSQAIKPPVENSLNSKGNERKFTRPKATWGKSNGVSSGNLCGPPPEIFMMNCRNIIQEENVLEHFKSHNINLVEVKKRSHENARKHSFILTVSNREDYNKILSGDLIPEDVGVRRYRPARYDASKVNLTQADQVSAFLRSSSVEKALLSTTPIPVVSQNMSDGVASNER